MWLMISEVPPKDRQHDRSKQLTPCGHKARKEKQDRDRDKMPRGPVFSLTAYLAEPSKTTPLAGDQLFKTGYCLDIAYLLSLNKILISKYQRAKLMHD